MAEGNYPGQVDANAPADTFAETFKKQFGMSNGQADEAHLANQK